MSKYIPSRVTVLAVVLVVTLLASACTPGAANPPAAAMTEPASPATQSAAGTQPPQEPLTPMATVGATSAPTETAAPVAPTETAQPGTTVQATVPVIRVTPATLSGTPSSLPGTGGACPMSDEEYAVYSAVIQEKFLKNRDVRMIVLQDTTTGMMPGDIPPVQEDFLRAQKPDLADDLLADLNTKMVQPCVFEQRFTVQIPVRLISQAEQEQIFQQHLDKAWTGFYAQFPGAQGILEFSRVGFSKDGNVAVVYAGNQQGGLAGGGYNYVLEKHNHRWVIVAETMTWIS